MTQDRASVDIAMRQILQDSLGLPPERVASFQPETELFGTLPELDSLALANLLTEIEDGFGIRFEEVDVDADLFSTFGRLTDVVVRKMAQ